MEIFDWQAYAKRVAWFQEARFGMFIHWGLYAIPARGEWVRNNERLSIEDYRPFFDEFTAADFDPKFWAKEAKAAGFQYCIFTAKHHDGFCLFDTAYTDYKSTNTPFGKDAVKEVLDAFRAEGLKVGLYYSLLDWHHPHYPHYNDPIHPMRGKEEYLNHTYEFDLYLDYMHKQVAELASNYGKLDIFWFDYSYGELTGEAWRGQELVGTLRRYHPDIIINNRLEVSGEGFGSLLSANPKITAGDFVSPEQIIPPQGIRNENKDLIPWEACITLNEHWGYAKDDYAFKSPELIIKKLIECVSKNGNLLLNVGPDARGRIPLPSLSVLREIASWFDLNKEAVIGAGSAQFAKPDYGYYTQKGRVLYYHVMEGVIGYLPLTGINQEKIEKIRLLKDGSELPIIKNWITNNYNDIAYVSLGPEGLLPYLKDTVLKIYLKE